MRKTELSWKFERRPSGSPESGWKPQRLKGWKPHLLPVGCSWMLGGAGRSRAFQTDGTPGKPCACPGPDEPPGTRFGRLANRRVLPLFPPSLAPFCKEGFSPVLWHLIISMATEQWCPKHMTSPCDYAKGEIWGFDESGGGMKCSGSDASEAGPQVLGGDALAPHWSNLDQTTEGCLSLGNNLELERPFI